MTNTGTIRIDLASAPWVELIGQMKDKGPVPLYVSFSQPFQAPPAVLLSLTGFKGGGEHHWFHVEPANITTEGFDIMIHTRRNWIDWFEISWLAVYA